MKKSSQQVEKRSRKTRKALASVPSKMSPPLHFNSHQKYNTNTAMLDIQRITVLMDICAFTQKQITNLHG